MKRKIAVAALLTCIIIQLLVPAAAATETVAYPVEGGNLYFDPTTGAITGCDSGVTAANIPSQIAGAPVTWIGHNALEYASNLTRVTIPSSVTCIGLYAFGSCKSLESVIVGENVTKIMQGAFVRCESLKYVCFLGDAPEMGPFAFQTYDWLDAQSGYRNIDGLTLYYLADKDGWCAPTWNGYPSATWDGKYVPGSAPSDSFCDIPIDAWYRSAVDYAVENGLMNGMGNGEFRPDEPTTRAMVVTILHRLSDDENQYENTFSDVLNDNWYTDAIAWAAHHGIVNGVGSHTFEPEASMTREMLAVILYRYTTENTIVDTSQKTDLSAYPDGDGVSFWAKDAVRWAVANGIINGVGEGKNTYLRPLGNATRAQGAAILLRYIENVLNK